MGVKLIRKRRMEEVREDDSKFKNFIPFKNTLKTRNFSIGLHCTVK